jgi:hypothetical protein
MIPQPITAHPLIATALATFFFGFGAGAALNLYLIAVKSPFLNELRGSLDYKSSIFGDGILLPAVNVLVVATLRDHRALVNPVTLLVALGLGLAATAYFHIVQAVRGIVNWAMPKPWRWNILGLWHAIYMLSVATLLSLFYVSAIAGAFGDDPFGWGPVGLVTVGIVAFFALLRLDYVTVKWSALVPAAVARRLH